MDTRFATAAVFLGLLTPPVGAGPNEGARFTPLGRGFGPGPNGEAFYIPSPADMTPDGAVIVGTGVPAASQGTLAFEAWRWTAATGMVGLGDLPGGRQLWSRAAAVSANGAVVVGTGNTGDSLLDRAFVWTQAGGLVELPAPPGLSPDVFTIGADVSPDGQTVLGSWWDSITDERAGVLWTPDGATGALPASYPVRMTPDLSTIVGVALTEGLPRAWVQAPGGDPAATLFLPTPTGTSGVCEPASVSDDGQIVIGWYESELPDGFGGLRPRAFRWTSAGGMADLGGLACGVLESWALAVSADGATIVGKYNCPTVAGRGRAFIWTATDGMRDLNNLAAGTLGLDLQGWELTDPQVITPNGRRIAGLGVDPEGRPGAWLLVLPPVCPADFNGADGATAQDVYDFLSAWSESDPSANFNGDGGVSVQDIYDFLAAWIAGCG